MPVDSITSSNFLCPSLYNLSILVPSFVFIGFIHKLNVFVYTNSISKSSFVVSLLSKMVAFLYLLHVVKSYDKYSLLFRSFDVLIPTSFISSVLFVVSFKPNNPLL